MNLPRSVADVLDDHVVFEVDCIDRMYCNVYVPGLQYAAVSSTGFDGDFQLPLSRLLGEGCAAVRGLVLDWWDESDLPVEWASPRIVEASSMMDGCADRGQGLASGGVFGEFFDGDHLLAAWADAASAQALAGS